MNQAPAPSQPHLRVPSGWAAAALGCAALVALAQTALWLTVWGAADEYAEAADTGRSAADVVTAYDVFSVLHLFALVTAYVVTCVWLGRARTLAERLSPDARHARGRIWVWLGWWVPVVNLWFPHQVVRDVRDGSGAPRSSVLGVWWACWVVWLVASRVAARLVPADDVPDPDLVAAMPWVETVTVLACLMALVTWTQLVRDVTGAQVRRVRGER